ncbi:MAG: NHL repeat-containing protein [Planctomycetota bacterium]
MAGTLTRRLACWKAGLALGALSVCLSCAQATDIIQTIAGGGSLEGYKPDQANLLLGGSQGLAVNALGEVLVSDSGHHQVLKINPTTGLITVVAGNGTACYFGDGLPAYSAGLQNPGALLLDAQGNLYIADRGNFVIRKVDALSGLISTVAGNGLSTGQVVGPNPQGDGGQATLATFGALGGMALDSHGHIIVADSGNACVRLFTLGGTISTIAGMPGKSGYSGDGAAGSAVLTVKFSNPTGVAVDKSDNIFIGDSGNRRVRRLDTTSTVITVVGDGTGGGAGFGGDGGLATAAQVGSLGGLTFDASGNLLISCVGAGRIRRVDPTGIIVTLAGNGGTVIGDLGPATGASLSSPRDVALDSTGNIFIYDSGHGRVRRVDKTTGFIDTVIGTGLLGFIGDRGPNQDGVLAGPQGADMDASGNLYIADTNDNAVRMVSPAGTITTLAGNGTTPGLGDGGPAYLGTLAGPTDVAVFGTTLFICDNGNNAIRKVNLANGTISTYAPISSPVALVVDAAGTLYVAHNNQVDKVATDGTVTPYVGSSPKNSAANPNGDGLQAANCRLNGPSGLFIGPSGELYIADTGHNLVRLISAPPQSLTSTVAGGGSPVYPSVGDGGPANQALLSSPMGVTLDSTGTHLIISDTGNQRIRAVDFTVGVSSSGNITTIAGTGTAGFSGDGDLAASALVNNPQKIFRYVPVLVPAPVPTLILADTGNNRIRKIITAIDVNLPQTGRDPASQPNALGFAAKLSFAIDKKTQQMANGKDSVALKAALPLPAGIAAANLKITVDIVDLHQQIQLDANGKLPKPPKAAKAQKVVQLFNFTLPQGELPSTDKFSLGLKGTSVAGGKATAFSFASTGTFREELGRAGFSNVTTLKAGTSLPLRVNITLGTTTFTGLTTVVWKATQDKGGTAQSVKK